MSGGGTSRSRFGFALSSAGDLNLDGFNGTYRRPFFIFFKTHFNRWILDGDQTRTGKVFMGSTMHPNPGAGLSSPTFLRLLHGAKLIYKATTFGMITQLVNGHVLGVDHAHYPRWRGPMDPILG